MEYTELEKMVEYSAEGIMVVDHEGVIVFLNTAAATMLGGDKSALIGQQFGTLAYSGKSTEIELLQENGEVLIAELHTKETKWSGNSALLAFLRDVTNRKLSEALEQTADSVLITDKQGIIQYVNPSFEALSGYSSGVAKGQKPNIVKSDKHPAEFYTNLWKTILAGEVFRDTVINRRRDGSIYYEQKTISPMYDEEGNITHFLSTGQDITEQLNTESRLRYLTTYDPLTGLLNQSELIRKLEQWIDSLTDKHSHIAVVVIGLDNFLRLNEVLGKSFGEQILQSLSGRLTQAMETSAIARIGEDKFCLAVQMKNPTMVVQRIDSWLNHLSEPLEIRDEVMVVTATAGISWYPEDGQEGGDLVQKAETAMYIAKNDETHRFRAYTSDMQAQFSEYLQITKDLLGAMERQEFTVYYHPQVDLTTGRPAGAEALVRWLPSYRDPVSPEKFIPYLEEMGMIGELGDFVLRSASETCLRLQQEELEMPCISVNISALQLQDPAFVEKVTQILESVGLAPQSLELEITESVLITRYEEVQDRLAELKELGVGVALDDFGTGYSSLQYLTRYPFSKLKIDKSFVWNMETSPKDWEVIKTIILFGRSLGIRVVAEGAEHEKHVSSLRELGCDKVQGYYHSPPVPEEKFKEFLRSLH